MAAHGWVAGIASHGSGSLSRDFQWKPPDIPGTQPPLSDTVVKSEFYEFISVNVFFFFAFSAPVSLICLAPHFRLLRVCEESQHKGDLEGIDALLGKMQCSCSLLFK